MNEEKILITGAAGFIGSSLANYLMSKSIKADKILLIDNFMKQKFGEELLQTFNLDIKNCDCNSKSVHELIRDFQPNHVIHLAGQSSGERSSLNRHLDFSSNVTSLSNVLSALEKQENLKSVLYASSMAVYGNKYNVTENDLLDPISPYGYHKIMGENILKTFSISNREVKCIPMRLFNVYGPGQDFKDLKQGMVSIFMSMAFHNNHVEVKGSLDRIRDFIYIDDVTAAINHLIFKYNFQGFKIINIAKGKSVKVQGLLEEISKYFNFDISVLEKGTPFDQDYCSASNKLLTSSIGFNPEYDLVKGIELMSKWLINKKHK